MEAYALWLEFKNACFVVGGLVYYFVLLKWRLHRSAHLGNYECLKQKPSSSFFSIGIFITCIMIINVSIIICFRRWTMCGEQGRGRITLRCSCAHSL